MKVRKSGRKAVSLARGRRVAFKILISTHIIDQTVGTLLAFTLSSAHNNPAKAMSSFSLEKISQP